MSEAKRIPLFVAGGEEAQEAATLMGGLHSLPEDAVLDERGFGFELGWDAAGLIANRTIDTLTAALDAYKAQEVCPTCGGEPSPTAPCPDCGGAK